MRAMPSPTSTTRPTSETSNSAPYCWISCLMTDAISSVLIFTGSPSRVERCTGLVGALPEGQKGRPRAEGCHARGAGTASRGGRSGPRRERSTRGRGLQGNTPGQQVLRREKRATVLSGGGTCSQVLLHLRQDRLGLGLIAED